MNDKERVQKQFGINPEGYATSHVHAQGSSLGRLVEIIEPQADWHILDVATGAGHTAFVFAPYVAKVVATDLTQDMLDVAARLGREKGLDNVVFKLADAEALPFDEAMFDLVTCRIAAHHFPQIGRFLAESARVLRPNGILALVDNVVPGSRLQGKKGDRLREAGKYINSVEKLRDPSHGRCLSIDEWADAFQEAGFALQHQETASKAIEFYPWVNRMGVSPENITRLQVMLQQAPEIAAEYFNLQVEGKNLTFYLDEAILIAQKTS